MSNRRSSGHFGASAAAALAEIGTPYQIFAEAVDAGKTLEGTKKKLCWRYGYSNSTASHTIDLKVSLFSGKKTILQDGKEIFSGGSVLETEFAHGWSADGHIFRLEVSLGVSESTFELLIDSKKFADLPDRTSLPAGSEALNGPMGGTTSSSGFGSSGVNTTPDRRASGNFGSSNTTPADRRASGHFDSKKINPFAAPISSELSSNTNNTGGFSSDPFAPTTTTTPTAAAANDDPFGINSDPFSATQPAKRFSTGNVSSVLKPPAGAPANSRAHLAHPHHVRGSISGSTGSNGSNGSTGTGNVLDDIFASSGVIAAVTVAPTTPQPASISTSTSNDPFVPPASVFDSFTPTVVANTTTNDPFAPTNTNTNTNPVRRPSSLVDDFANTPFDLTPQKAAPSAPVVDVFSPQAEVETTPVVTTEPTPAPAPVRKASIYDGLVNLDLGSGSGSTSTGGSTTTQTEAQRRGSIQNTSRSLNGMLIQNQNQVQNQGRPMSMSMNPTDMNTLNGNSNGNGYNSNGYNANTTMSGMNGRPQSMNLNSNTIGVNSYAPSQSNTNTSTQPPKRTSLDSLNWK